MFITAAFVLFTALLASADSAPPSMPINGPAGIVHVTGAEGKHSSFEKTKVSSKAVSPSMRLSYHACKGEEQKQIARAVKEAQKYAKAAYQHLKSNPNGSELLHHWFGGFDPERYQSILKSSSTLRKLPQTWEYQCVHFCPTVGNNTRYAWANTERPGTFNICPAFWELPPAKNSNLKAFNIIQEGTHFREVLGIENHVYGYSNSLKLVTSPEMARTNGPNHAYFFLAAWGEEVKNNLKSAWLS
ncbi:unnamed protein product [Rhizoctonia solani]|uniref:Lysine-specific metallo-endopeptidase domain-containing protein n=1 Tax=Rhizoctonia solani TaxID=456999 RepID=A0A8H3AT18_9AGAM|nr:unnamed protein product [Rhizoctonia solani]